MLSLFFFFFILEEFYFLSNFSFFWFLILTLFLYYAFFRWCSPALKNFFFLSLPVLIILFFLSRLNLFSLPVFLKHFFLLFLACLFLFLLYLYRKLPRGSLFFYFFPYLFCFLLIFSFFSSNPLENYFLKELFLFLGLIFLFEADRFLLAPQASFLFTLIPALLLTELAWLLNFLPLNLLVLSGIWLIFCYLLREFFFLWFKNLFQWRFYLPQLVLTLFLLFILLTLNPWFPY